jgi:DNA-binding response OmpR family regulator
VARKRQVMRMDNITPLPIDRPYTKMALMIEDDPDICELLEFYLKDAGYYPLVFTNAEDVLTILRSLVMEIIIIDLMLPGMDGVEFVREIERHKRRNAPILVISASEQGHRRAQEINAEGYMQKPLSFPKFIQLVNRLVEEHIALRRYDALL